MGILLRITSLLVGLLVSYLVSANTVLAVDYIKTVTTNVGVSETQVSSAVNLPFSLYIGDNINGVANPIKSVYFTISGVYTGNGTLLASIDSDGATVKTFTLPSVSGPKPFEILYKDTSNKINPSTSGGYAYTLNLIPTGVTISGLSVTVTVTYRYAPVSCDEGSPSNEKVKTVKSLVGVGEAQISSTVNLPFAVYVGDNITGVVSPVKSLYFTITGVYTGNGSLQATIDSDGATSAVFTLPSVSGPTPFEILYKDTTGKISPTSAGSYAYTFNLIPTGVTISGLGIVLNNTYRYKPPSCGLPPTGELTSVVFDTTGVADGPAYNAFIWKGTFNSGTGKVRFQLATSDCPNAQTNPPTCSTSGTWQFKGGATCSSGDWYTATNPDVPVEISCSALNHNNQRYFKYKVQLCSASDCTSSGSISPQVLDIGVNWSP
jgi:hypothetical protein